MTNYFPSDLEHEAVYIFRETAAQFQNPYILFSGGKDSITLVHLALKAFGKENFPFKLLHIDTGHNFKETLDFRDALVDKYNLHLEVRYVEDAITRHNLKEQSGKYASRNKLQSYALLDAIEELKIDAAIGGARRDEEKARAKERIFSIRDGFGGWDPKNQRPELFGLLNGRIDRGENVRVFPISNWTELDVWYYIEKERIQLPSLYFSHTREVFERDAALWTVHNDVFQDKDEETKELQVRFRTIGDVTCTAAVPSFADDISKVIDEIKSSKISERGSRMDDKVSEAAMEERKAVGYF